MSEMENKKETTETTERPKRKKIFYKRFPPRVNFTPKIKEVIDLLQDSFPKLFTRRPEPKYALKIGIYYDLLPWANEHNISKTGLRKALRFWCYGKRYKQALFKEKRYDLDFNETPFYHHQIYKNEPNQYVTEVTLEAAVVSTSDTSTKRKKITYPENWAEIYPRWKNKEISFKEAMELTGLKQSTFYRLAREYAEKN